MKSFSKSFGAVGSESAKHSKHPIALRLFYSLIVFVVGAALLPVIPVAAAVPPGPQVPSAPSAYTAVNPTRVMDTRTGSGMVGAGNTLGPAASFSLVVAPNATAGVPANATAVVMNVTVTNTTAPSYLTVYPTLDSLPFASNLNWVAGYTVPNLVTVQPGSGGAVTFYNKFGSVDVIADIAGYFAPPSGSAGGEVGTGFPQRLVDTRAGSGHLGAGSALGPAATATYQVTGNAGVPATGVSAVILNSTVTNTTAASFLTLWAGAPATRNTVSNDNWVAGWTRANRVIVPVSSTGSISVYNQFGSVDVILDVNGYFTDATASGKLFTSVSPIRLADHTALGPNSSFNLSVGGVAGVPVGASAAILDAVVSETTAPSFLTASPSPGVSSTSDVNWVAGQVNPNLTVTTLGTGGQVNFYNSAGNVNVSVDLEGYFGSAGAGVNVSANPTSIPANNGAAGGTSTVTATVTKADGTAAIADLVNFTTSGGTTCGTLTGNPATTDGTGKASVTYHSSSTAGTCTITATEASGGLTGSTVITQTQVKNKISNAPSNASLLANGTATQLITTTVLNGVSSAAVAGDTVNYTMSGSPSAACGTLSASTGTTNASGQTTTTYTTTTTTGFCTVTATETGTGNSATTVITQHGTSANSVAVAANPTSIAANGTSTSTVTATITGTGTAGDPVAFTTAGGASCGTFSPVTTTANTSGVATSTYTSSTTAGTCVVTATEANGGFSNTATITQTAVLNNIALSASPTTLGADGSSTSTVTATVTNGVTSAAVAADSITFTTTGTCGPFTTANPKATDASGMATITYRASTIVGFCTIKGTEQAGAPGTGNSATTTINQQSAAASTVTVTASPASVPADNVTTSTVTAAVRNSSGGAVVADSVLFSLSGSACGTLVGGNPTNTGPIGNAVITYKASATVGSCTITATEASAGKTGSVSISQTTVLNAVAQTAAPNPIAADGTSTSTITTTVTHSGTAVAADAVTYTTSGSPAAACGALSGSTSPTNASGVVTVTYTASLTVGFCTVTATEAGNGQTASTVITQKGAGANTTAVVANPTTITANGTSTSTITATVSGAGSAGDPVSFTLTGANCGTLSSAFATTNGSGVATTTYTSKAISGTSGATTTCVVNAREANAGSAGSATVTQNSVPNSITLTGNPTTIRGDGISTSTLTAHVTNGITGAVVASDTVAFYFPGGGTCGTFTGGVSVVFVVTDASGNSATTYKSALAPGTICNIDAQEFNTFSIATVLVITQTT